MGSELDLPHQRQMSPHIARASIPLHHAFQSFRYPLRHKLHPVKTRAPFYRPCTRRFTASLERQAEWPYLYRTTPSPTMAPQLDSYFKQVDSLSDHFIDRLSKAVAIPSVSAADEHRPDVVKVQSSNLLIQADWLRHSSDGRVSRLRTPKLRRRSRAPPTRQATAQRAPRSPSCSRRTVWQRQQ